MFLARRLAQCAKRSLFHHQQQRWQTTTAVKFITQDDRRDFMAVFPDVVRDLTEHDSTIPEIANLYTKVLQYNVPGGKKLRGLTVVYSYRLLEKPELFTPETVLLSQILGWCIEMFEAFFLVVDDVMDGSDMRRGRPAWYKVPGVGVRALSDAFLIESSIYKLLKKHLSNHSQYLPIVELIHSSILTTTLGQTMDYNTNCNGADISKINMDRYNFIAEFKTSVYSFYTPVALGMYLANVVNPEHHRQAKIVLLEMGRYFQVQDDYLDIFGDEEITGKNGTDIQDGKCSWLSVVALQRASPAQKELFKNCFGQADPEKVQKIKDLYKELGLEALYATYEEDTYKMITTHIQQLSAGLPHDLFFGLLEKIYRRRR